MPLLDHFRPPLHPIHHWESFHSNWATRIADALEDRLPPGYLVEASAHLGRNLEVDIATLDRTGVVVQASVPAALPQAFTPPEPPLVMPAVFPESFEVRVFSLAAGLTLIGAVELVSPSNKDRAEERRAFAAKIASYLHRGVSVIIIDVITNRGGNLHDETMRIMEADSANHLPAGWDLYAVAYRPVIRESRALVEMWPARCGVGQALPTLPLRLVNDVFLPVDFEATYQEACRRRRIA